MNRSGLLLILGLPLLAPAEPPAPVKGPVWLTDVAAARAAARASGKPIFAALH